MTAGLVSSQFCMEERLSSVETLTDGNSDVRSDQRRSRRSTRTRDPPRRPCKVNPITDTAILLEQSYLLIPNAWVIVLQVSNDREGQNRNFGKSRFSPPSQMGDICLLDVDQYIRDIELQQCDQQAWALCLGYACTIAWHGVSTETCR